jgi:hypothetical protein
MPSTTSKKAGKGKHQPKLAPPKRNSGKKTGKKRLPDKESAPAKPISIEAIKALREAFPEVMSRSNGVSLTNARIAKSLKAIRTSAQDSAEHEITNALTKLGRQLNKSRGDRAGEPVLTTRQISKIIRKPKSVAAIRERNPGSLGDAAIAELKTVIKLALGHTTQSG